eukprot:COSAG06_NODE_4852_length_3906_cov_4.946677_2_plen_344_part_00
MPVAVLSGAAVDRGDKVRWCKSDAQVAAGSIGRVKTGQLNERGRLLVEWPNGIVRGEPPDALLKAVDEQEADKLLGPAKLRGNARADKPLLVGTPICVAGRGPGVYVRANTRWFGANEHVIDFDSGGEQTLVLRNELWTVFKKEMQQMVRLTDRWKRARESPHWVADGDAVGCMLCAQTFTSFTRRHHCRSCGWVVCSLCSAGRTELYRWLDSEEHCLKGSTTPAEPQRTCDVCCANPAGVPPLALEGHPLPAFDGAYRKVSEHKGWPVLRNGAGMFCYRYEPTEKWFLSTVNTPDKSACTSSIVSAEGPLPIGAQTWRCYVDGEWVKRSLSVTVLVRPLPLP